MNAKIPANVSDISCRIKLADQKYTDGFNEELEAFKERVRYRAQVKVEEAVKQVEEASLVDFGV